MRSDTDLKNDGMRILSEQLGLVDAERFIALIRRESFDYTKWQRDLFSDVPLDELFEDAADPFYSASNMNHLKKLVSDIETGKAKLTEHDLIED